MDSMKLNLPPVNQIQHDVEVWNKDHPDNPVMDMAARAATRGAWKRVFLVNDFSNNTVVFKELNMVERMIRYLSGLCGIKKDTIFPQAENGKIAAVFNSAVISSISPTTSPRDTLLGPDTPIEPPTTSTSPPSPPPSVAQVNQPVETPTGEDSPRLISPDKMREETIRGIDLYERDLRKLIANSLGVRSPDGKDFSLVIRTFDDIVQVVRHMESISILEEQLQEFGLTELHGKVIFQDVDGVPLTAQQKQLLVEVKQDLKQLKEHLSYLVNGNRDWIEFLYKYEESKPLSDLTLVSGRYDDLLHCHTCLTEVFGLQLDVLSSEPSKVGVLPISSNRIGGPLGLPNIGNSCYMNSGFQALLVTMKHLEPIIMTPIKRKQNPEESIVDFSRRKEVQKALKNVIEMANLNKSEKEMQFALTILREKISLMSPDIRSNLSGQHDPSAMINPVLEALDVAIPIKEISFREVNFDGELMVDESVNYESTRMLELSIPVGSKDLTLQRLLEQELSTVDLDGHSEYDKKRKEIDGVPKILPLLVKRATAWKEAEYKEFMATEMQRIKSEKGGTYDVLKADYTASLKAANLKANKVASDAEVEREAEAKVTLNLTAALNKEHGFQVNHIPRVIEKVSEKTAAGFIKKIQEKNPSISEKDIQSILKSCMEHLTDDNYVKKVRLNNPEISEAAARDVVKSFKELEEKYYLERIRLMEPNLSDAVARKSVTSFMGNPKRRELKFKKDLVLVNQLRKDNIGIPENDRIKVPVMINGERKVLEYSLTCSVKHKGVSSSGGHYTSHVIQRNTVVRGGQEVEEKRYFHCNDSKVTGEDRATAKMGEGYIFFFELVEPK